MKIDKTKAKLFILTLIFLTPLANLGIDIYTPSLPSIASSLGAKISLVKLSVPLYLISYGIGQLFFGIISDGLGRRLILLLGICGFIISSLISGMVHHINLLLLMRLLQGLSASIISVVTKSIITDKYKGSRLAIISNYKVLSQILSLIIAPLIGGYIQLKIGWRWNFFFLTLYGVASLGCAILFMRETIKYKVPFRKDYIRRNISEIFSNSVFLLIILNLAVLYGVVGLFGIFGPFLLQETMHYNSLVYGLMALLSGFCYMLGSIISKKMFGRNVLVFYFASFIISPIVLVFIAFTDLTSILLPIFLIMFSAGLILPKLMSQALGCFKKQAGTASAFLGTFVMLGSGIIIGLASFFHTNNAIPMSIFYLISCVVSLVFTLVLEQKQKRSFHSL